MPLAFLPSPEIGLWFGFGLSGLMFLALLDHLNPKPKESFPVPIPETIAAALTDLQTAQDAAQARATAAHEKETAAVQAREMAEAAKVEGKTANDQLDQKRAAFVALVSGAYVAPTLPPPATPPAPPAAPIN